MQLLGLRASRRHCAILNCLTMEKNGGARECKALLATPAGQQKIRERMAPVMVDLSQNPQRAAYSNRDGNMKCMCTSAVLFSFGKQRVVTPLELLAFQGHDIQKMRVPSGMTLRQIKDLAAMGICLPNLALYILAMRAVNIL